MLVSLIIDKLIKIVVNDTSYRNEVVLNKFPKCLLSFASLTVPLWFLQCTLTFKPSLQFWPFHRCLTATRSAGTVNDSKHECAYNNIHGKEFSSEVSGFQRISWAHFKNCITVLSVDFSVAYIIDIDAILQWQIRYTNGEGYRAKTIVRRISVWKKQNVTKCSTWETILLEHVTTYVSGGFETLHCTTKLYNCMERLCLAVRRYILCNYTLKFINLNVCKPKLIYLMLSREEISVYIVFRR